MDLTFSWDGLSLAGTLHNPDAEGPHPAVLMMQGSGVADRDSGGYFVPIRETFLRMGIATFSFDKPGCGASTGDWRHYALEGRAAQAMTAVEFLRCQPSVDEMRVGIWGQSQGGWLAQMLASRLPDLAFAIANSGPSIDIAAQNLYGCSHTLRAQGFDDDDIEQALVFMSDLQNAAFNAMSYEEVETTLLADARKQPWYGYVSIEDAEDWAEGCVFATDAYQPREAMARIECPFLAIYGGRDVLVPAWQGVEESGIALDKAPTTDATVVVFPNGDHRIRDGSTGNFVDGYLDLLGDWMAKRVFTEHS